MLFVGNPTRYNDVSQWAMVRQWVALHGMEPIRELEGDVLCVIVTEDILDGRCSPKELAAVQHARALGVPCISVHDTTLIWQVTAAFGRELGGHRWCVGRAPPWRGVTRESVDAGPFEFSSQSPNFGAGS